MPYPAGAIVNSTAGNWHSVRPWSLWDIMINFNVYTLSTFIRTIQLCETHAQLENDSDLVDEDEKSSWPAIFKEGLEQCELLHLRATCDRIEHIKKHLKARMTQVEWKKDLQTLRETIIDDLKSLYCYRYPSHKAEVYWAFENQWKEAIAKFPSAREDAFEAVDCYALERNTASVFHAMRVAEIGLRALARERRVKFVKRPLEWAHWQDLINGIRGKVKIIENQRAGPNKTAALDYYQGALGEFEAFKDVYRNNVMHVRVIYDEHRALSALIHVREFMTRLASRLDEKDKKQIKWGHF